jgi:hypothetical protein
MSAIGAVLAQPARWKLQGIHIPVHRFEELKPGAPLK